MGGQTQHVSRKHLQWPHNLHAQAVSITFEFRLWSTTQNPLGRIRMGLEGALSYIEPVSDCSFYPFRPSRNFCTCVANKKMTLSKISWPRQVSMFIFGNKTLSFTRFIGPDIRSLFVLFLLSFVDRSSPSNVKNSFLEQRRDLLASMFKGLVQDPYPLVRKVFEILWDGMWSDTKIKRSLKVAIFNENTITQVSW